MFHISLSAISFHIILKMFLTNLINKKASYAYVFLGVFIYLFIFPLPKRLLYFSETERTFCVPKCTLGILKGKMLYSGEHLVQFSKGNCFWSYK